MNGAYDSLSQGFDTFVYANQNFLPFVAAGNFGTTGLDSSVSSPATAKNIVAVGACPAHPVVQLAKCTPACRVQTLIADT